MKKVFLVLLAVAFVFGAMFAGNAQAVVSGTAHDLSADVAAATDQICVFCHHPHRGTGGTQDELLWNQKASSVSSWATYTSAGIDATTVGGNVDAATGTSFLCLACHDGTVATDSLVRGPGDGNLIITGTNLGAAANLGTTLVDDHPVNISLSGDANMAAQTTVEAADLVIFTGGMIQCATCHDVHDKADSVTTGVAFMRQQDWAIDSKICVTCHINK